MKTRPREISCSPIHPFFWWTSSIKPVMQIWPRPPIRNQLMHLLHHNIASRAWSYLLISAPPTPPDKLSSITNIIITAPHIHFRPSFLQVRLVSRHGTLHTRDMSSKYNTANANIPDIRHPYIVWAAPPPIKWCHCYQTPNYWKRFVCGGSQAL